MDDESPDPEDFDFDPSDADGADDSPEDFSEDADEWVPCALSQILATDPPDASYVVVLRELGGERAFPIHIGPVEWQAIHRPVHGITTPRPMTHDLLLACLSALDARLSWVRVRDLVEDEEGNGTFFGSLILERESETVEMDCRPSDAIALAIRIGCPIMVARSVMDQVGGG